MKQQQRPSDEALLRVVRLRKAFRDRTSERMISLGDASTPPLCIQARAKVIERQVVHGTTQAPAAFPVDNAHFNEVVESMRSIRSPIHLPGAERPNAIRLTANSVLGGRNYPAGTVLIVEGTHRMAAAWALGWNMIPVRVVSGTAQDVADLAVVSNTKAVKPARSLEDIKNKILLYREAHGVLPTVPETMALCRASRATVYRVRSEYREELGLPDPKEQPRKEHAVPQMTPHQLNKLRSIIDKASEEESSLDCVQVTALLMSQLFDTDPRRQQIIAQGARNAIDDILEPDENPDF